MAERLMKVCRSGVVLTDGSSDCMNHTSQLGGEEWLGNERH